MIIKNNLRVTSERTSDFRQTMDEIVGMKNGVLPIDFYDLRSQNTSVPSSPIPRKAFHPEKNIRTINFNTNDLFKTVNNSNFTSTVALNSFVVN